MPVFRTRESAIAVFSVLGEILLSDPAFQSRMREDRLSVKLLHSNPDCTFLISDEGVLVDAVGPGTVEIRMSCDTAHALWSGKLNLPVALALRKVSIRGSVSKVLELLPLLRPAFDRYPAIFDGHAA